MSLAEVKRNPVTIGRSYWCEPQKRIRSLHSPGILWICRIQLRDFMLIGSGFLLQVEYRRLGTSRTERELACFSFFTGDNRLFPTRSSHGWNPWAWVHYYYIPLYAQRNAQTSLQAVGFSWLTWQLWTTWSIFIKAVSGSMWFVVFC